MIKADSTRGQDDECIPTVAEKREGTRPHGQFNPYPTNVENRVSS